VVTEKPRAVKNDGIWSLERRYANRCHSVGCVVWALLVPYLASKQLLIAYVDGMGQVAAVGGVKAL
jgi:hypothetical protein